LKYDVRLSKRAYRELNSLGSMIRGRVVSRLEELGEDPFPKGVVKLQGREGLYRVRVGDYRILYEVFTSDRLVLVEKLDRRSRVYGP
jgi:mRNA interferase RelE/StbE